MMNRRSLFVKAAAAGAALTLAGTNVALAGGAKKKGTFEGRSNHVTSGSVKLVKNGDRYIVELGDDFSLDGGPDPRVAFGKDGTYAPDTLPYAHIFFRSRNWVLKFVACHIDSISCLAILRR